MPTFEIRCVGPCGGTVLGHVPLAEGAPEPTPQRLNAPLCTHCRENWHPGGLRWPFFDPLNPPTDEA